MPTPPAQAGRDRVVGKDLGMALPVEPLLLGDGENRPSPSRQAAVSWEKQLMPKMTVTRSSWSTRR